MIKPQKFWRTVIFSDEGNFSIFGIKGRKLVWRKLCTALQKEHLVPTIKQGGGGVMMWGCMASIVVGNLIMRPSIQETTRNIALMAETCQFSDALDRE
ncbi:transposable element Tc1 transposase [Trichonephila clavipes]|nr:transposable element Tc1 transposase [Trichonephila clavipes]